MSTRFIQKGLGLEPGKFSDVAPIGVNKDTFKLEFSPNGETVQLLDSSGTQELEGPLYVATPGVAGQYAYLFQVGTYAGDGTSNLIDPAGSYVEAASFYPSFEITTNRVGQFQGLSAYPTFIGAGDIGTIKALGAGTTYSGSGVVSTAVGVQVDNTEGGAGSVTNAVGVQVEVQQASGTNTGFKAFDYTSGATGNVSFLSEQNSGTGNYAFKATGTAPSLFTGKVEMVTSANLAPTAFASLPASPVEGDLAWVNNSNTATWGATVAGGGANKVLVVYNGTNWTVAGK